jgi:hypothetical protein
VKSDCEGDITTGCVLSDKGDCVVDECMRNVESECVTDGKDTCIVLSDGEGVRCVVDECTNYLNDDSCAGRMTAYGTICNWVEREGDGTCKDESKNIDKCEKIKNREDCRSTKDPGHKYTEIEGVCKWVGTGNAEGCVYDTSVGNCSWFMYAVDCSGSFSYSEREESMCIVEVS